MAKLLQIHHVTLIADNLEETCAFYEREFNLQPLPAFAKLDFPAQFYRINEYQQLHISEFPDSHSFRGHVCFQVDDFNATFWRMKELGVVDTAPWGKVRRLPDGALQMFVRDPSGNLVEISGVPGTPVDDQFMSDELVQEGVGVYVSGRNETRGLRSDDASLYHERAVAPHEPADEAK
jgi:catechol 2,3-dioxygenase-like lactoylglutathione lyase family enzyme